MVRKILIIAFLLSVVFSVLYIYYLNSEVVTLSYSSAGNIKQPIGILVIGVFIVGALFASIIAMFFGIKLRWATKRLEKQQRMLLEHRKSLADARGQLALGDFSGAQNALAKIIQRDPDDVIARVLLAETFRRQNNLEAALNVLEQARIEQKKNAELLLLASDVNAELGNHTAAYDNAALILKLKPRNRFALERLVESCVSLGRLEDAIEYQQQLVKVLSGDEYTQAQENVAQLRTLEAVKRADGDPAELRKEVEGVLRNHRDHPHALSLLAELDQSEGDRESATKLLKKLFQLTKEVIHLECIAAIWLRAEEPAKALSNVRAALSSVTKREAHPEGQLFLANLLLHLEMVDQAKAEFAELEPQLEASNHLAPAAMLFKTKLLKRLGKADEALGIFFDSFEAATALPGESLFRDNTTTNGGTPPSWSKRIHQHLHKLPPAVQRPALP